MHPTATEGRAPGMSVLAISTNPDAEARVGDDERAPRA